jgi:hypothetical protein
MPYLNFETYENQSRMQEAVESVIGKGQRTRLDPWLQPFTTSTESLTYDGLEPWPRTSRHRLRYSRASSSQQPSHRIMDQDRDHAHERSNDEKLISAYLSNKDDPPKLHVRRTLDQYYYHMLEIATRWYIDGPSWPSSCRKLRTQRFLWSTSCGSGLLMEVRARIYLERFLVGN